MHDTGNEGENVKDQVIAETRRKKRVREWWGGGGGVRRTPAP